MFGKRDLKGFLKAGKPPLSPALFNKPDLISLKGEELLLPRLFSKPAFISLKLLEGEGLGSGKPDLSSEFPGTGPP